MRTEAFGMILMTSVLVSVAIAAVTLGPLNLANLGSPDGGETPQAAEIVVPTWREGDSWTYDVRAPSPDPYVGDMYWGGPSIAGTITRTVIAAEAGQYNVSVQGSFHVEALVDFARDFEFRNETILVLLPPLMEDATVDGFTVYRASDLARLTAVRTIRVSGSVSTDRGTFSASYMAKVATTYEPALDVWAFPLGENETWNVSSNATIRAWISWRFEGPDDFLEFGHNFTVTVPIHVMLHSGLFDAVTTPGGTFSAVPVRLVIPLVDELTFEDQLSPAMGLGADICEVPRAPVEAWFSGGAGNVVKAVAFLGGARVLIELRSFHRS